MTKFSVEAVRNDFLILLIGLLLKIIIAVVAVEVKSLVVVIVAKATSSSIQLLTTICPQAISNFASTSMTSLIHDHSYFHSYSETGSANTGCEIGR